MPKKLQPDALRLIIDNVESLLQEDIDETPIGSFWPSDRSFDAESCLKSKEDFETTFKTLQRLKDFQSALTPVISLLSKKIARIQDNILPASRHHGFMSLPVDIFMHILDILAEDCMVVDYGTSGRGIGFRGTRILTKRLMMVSRHFREGVVNNVSFWKGLDKEFCRNGLSDIRLARSKNAPLSLGFRFTGRKEMMELLSKALPFKDRFEHIQIKLRSKPSDVKRLFPAMEFPSVVSLCVLTSNRPGYEEFFDEWKFPRLRKLECTSYAPPPPGIFSGLMELKLSFGGGSFGTSYIQGLLKLLRSLETLRSLSLDVTRIPIPLHDELIQPVELPNLLDFAITNSTDATDLGQDSTILVFGQVFLAIGMPNVESMALSVHFNIREYTHHLYGIGRLLGRAVVCGNLIYPSVKRLALALTRTNQYRHRTIELPEILESFPNLQKLDIDAPGFVFKLDSYSNTAENIRSLEIKGNQYIILSKDSGPMEQN